jgi:hypothetical protein
MFRRLLDPKSNDNDAPYIEGAIAVATRFVKALDAKRYSEIWHELTADDTKEIFAAQAYLKHQEKLAEAFRMPHNEVTQEFLSYALANDVEGVRVGLWAGIRNGAGKNGWLRSDTAKAKSVFLNGGAVVFIPSSNIPMIVPLLRSNGGSYLVDMETFVVASRVLGVADFVLEAQRATETGAFERATRLLADAAKLQRAHGLLEQFAWVQIFTSARQAELRSDAALLLQVERLLVENRELAGLDVAMALMRDEDETLDFKEQMPPAGNSEERKKLARVFAAFATNRGGTVYFGITKLKEVVGIEDARTDVGRDEFRQRIDIMCRDNVTPSIAVRTVFLPYNTPNGSVIVPVVVIRSGVEPIYYVDGKPYTRRGQSAEPATPGEVITIISSYLEQHGWRPPE